MWTTLTWSKPSGQAIPPVRPVPPGPSWSCSALMRFLSAAMVGVLIPLFALRHRP
jgi:hypothetical protein